MINSTALIVPALACRFGPQKNPGGAGLALFVAGEPVGVGINGLC